MLLEAATPTSGSRNGVVVVTVVWLALERTADCLAGGIVGLRTFGDGPAAHRIARPPGSRP